jgi:hypothetical protein
MNLATVQFGRIFRTNLRREMEHTRDEALVEGGKIVRREVETSIRERWYDTEATLGSLEEQVVTEGESKTYRLTPTTFYAIFGEYGTGQRGSVTGKPAPRGWKYGDKPGMSARRFSRIAVGVARPQVEDVFQLKVRELAARLTQ